MIAIAALLTAMAAAATPPLANLAQLAAGIRQVQEGDLEAAVLTLDGAARQLASDPALARDAARAYLYMGVAYQGLGQESIARAKFRQAIRMDRALRPSPDEFSRTAIRSFEAALQTVDAAARTEREARKRWGKRPVVLTGLGGVATAGLATYLAIITTNAPDPPTASMTISPEGAALVHTTVVTFTSSVNRSDREWSCDWNLGDGPGELGAPAGRPVTHVYAAEGTFSVRLSCGEGAPLVRSISVRSLLGRWRFSGPIRGLDEVVFRPLTQRYHAADLVFGDPSMYNDTLGGGVRTLDPRRIDFRRTGGRDAGGATFSYLFAGDADPSLNTISGQVTCEVDLEQRCASAVVPFTLTRQ